MTDSGYYVGRFAPSPTGPLHFGSLVAALASYLDARHHNGRWLLRIEDLDPPRESPDAPRQIMSQLEGFGMHWDGEVLYQSDRLDAYQQALDQLRAGNLVYPCTCTRKMVGTIYNGRCRKNDFSINLPYSIRLVVGDMVVSLRDRVMGPLHYHLSKEVGDFIIRRKDGLFAYQLAVTVDDAFQQVTHVVRGSDLLDSTPRQIAVCRHLNLKEPSYAHIPVITGTDGSKLSKQTHAEPVDTRNAIPLLTHALRVLQQDIPARRSNIEQFMAQAIVNWCPDNIPRLLAIPFGKVSE